MLSNTNRQSTSIHPTPAVEPEVTVTLFTHASDARVLPHKVQRLDWSGLVFAVNVLSLRHALKKQSLPMLCPAVFSADRREDAAVERITVGILDFDNLTQAEFSELPSKLEGVRSIVYTSPGDDPAGVRKARVMVALDHPLGPAEHRDFLWGLTATLRVSVPDTKAFNPSRAFFVGHIDGQPTPEVFSFEGRPVPTAALVAIGRNIGKPAAAEPSNVAPSNASNVAPSNASNVAPAEPVERFDVDDSQIDALAEYFAPHAVPGERHALCWELGSWLGQRGWSEESIGELVRRLPVNDPEGRAKDARDGMRHPGGWSRIQARVGETAAASLDAHVSTNHPSAGVPEIAAAVERLMASRPANDVHPRPALFRFVDDSEQAYRRVVAEGFDLALGCVTAIQALPRRGKTPLLLGLLFAVANGQPFLSLPTVKGRAALFTWEKLGSTKVRKASVARALKVEASSVDLIAVGEPLTLATATQLAELVRAKGYSTIGIDTLNSAMGAVDQNAAEAASALKALSMMLPDVAIVVTCYERKSSGAESDLSNVAGNAAIAGAFDAAVRMVPDEMSRNRFTIESTRELATAPDLITIETSGDETAMCFARVPGATMLEREIARAKPRKPSAAERLSEAVGSVRLHLLQNPAFEGTALEWSTVMHRSRDLVARALRVAVADGEVTRRDGTGRRVVYGAPRSWERGHAQGEAPGAGAPAAPSGGPPNLPQVPGYPDLRSGEANPYRAPLAETPLADRVGRALAGVESTTIGNLAQALDLVSTPKVQQDLAAELHALGWTGSRGAGNRGPRVFRPAS